MYILDNRPKTIIINGYSTSRDWPGVLQRKLDRFYDGEQIITVKKAIKGGTPIAGWMNRETGEPKKTWVDILRPALQSVSDGPVIVLAQQSLQWRAGKNDEGIRGADDSVRIEQGADAISKYSQLLLKEGLGIQIKHILALENLPYHHRDPFDRLIISQSMTENIPILSSDKAYDLYPINRVW